MTRRFRSDSREDKPLRPNPAACEAELGRILSSRVFNGGHVNAGKSSLRFGGSRVHKETLERIVRASFEGRTPTILDVTGGRRRTEKYVHVTVARLSDRLVDYYRYEGAQNPTRIDVTIRRNIICVDCTSASLEPFQQEFERALYHLNRQSPAHLQKAREHVQQAIALNERDAAAHALFSEIILLEAMHTFSKATLPLIGPALREAEQAVELDSSSWRAYAALGGVREWNLDFSGAEAAFSAAVARDSLGLWDYEAFYGHLIAVGESERAVRLAEAFQHDRPADPIAHRTYGMCLHIAGRQTDAERALQEALRLDPALWLAAITLVLVYLETNRATCALESVEPLVQLEPQAWPGLHIVCLSAAGRSKQATRQLEALAQRAHEHYVQPIQLALGYMAAGDIDRGFEYLAAACDERHPMMDWVHRWPLLRPLRTHRGYKSLLKRLKVPTG